MISQIKDAVSSRAAMSFVNNQIARYGVIQELTINSRQKTVDVTCLLHGEPTPIAVRVENYVVEVEGDKKFLRITRFSCARPWLQNLLTDYGNDRRVELPAWAAAAL